MVATIGLTGFRPAPSEVALVTSPPYDVIKKGSKLEALLSARPHSLFHVILGEQPADAFERLKADGALIADDEPAYYVCEQTWDGPKGREQRTGVFLAVEVSPYSARQIIRHEKTFDDKVKGRVALARATGHTFGPVFALTKAKLAPTLAKAKQGEPLYAFSTDLQGLNDLHGISTRIFRVPQASALGAEIQAALAPQPFYIADGHHRYHAALLNPQTHALCYVTEEARIQAYDRVVSGPVRFDDVKSALKGLRPAADFATPAKHEFAIYTRGGSYLLSAQHVPKDVVGGLDCSILERELYPHLALTHSMIQDPKHFDYYPESQIDQMKAVVDRGDYDLAIALHPVAIDELIAVADAGLEDANVVMPEKSTFFAPKVLSGLFVYRHVMK